MAESFSWSDTLQIALGSCLPCVRPPPSNVSDDENQNHTHNPAINRIPRARHDELQGLLADTDTATDVDVETLSLHSNPGRSNYRNKKRNKKRTSKSASQPRRIKLFGYDLFGKRAPPVQLADDVDDAIYRGGRSADAGATTSLLTAHSSSTFDSDAAPLDPALIASLSTSPETAAALTLASEQAEAQRLKEKEERKQKRKERKEMKRVAKALAERGVVGDDGDDFEGFQGSGSMILPEAQAPDGQQAYPRMPTSSFYSSSSRAPQSDSGSGWSSQPSQPPAPTSPAIPSPASFIPNPQAQDDDDDAAADLDGALYSRQRRPYPPSRLGGGGGSASDSRSRASASDRGGSNDYTMPPDPRNVLERMQTQMHSQVNPTEGEVIPKTKTKKSKKSSSTAGSRTTYSRSSATTASQSPSLPSPKTPSFPQGVQQQQLISPSTVETGLGFFDTEDLPSHHDRNSSLTSSAGLPVAPQSQPPPREKGNFPSTGFGSGGGGATWKREANFRAANGRVRDMGAFLARRGEDDVTGDGL